MIPVTSSFEARGQFFNTMFWKHNDWIETDSLLYRHLPLETRFVCFIDGAVADNVSGVYNLRYCKYFV